MEVGVDVQRVFILDKGGMIAFDLASKNRPCSISNAHIPSRARNPYYAIDVDYYASLFDDELFWRLVVYGYIWNEFWCQLHHYQ